MTKKIILFGLLLSLSMEVYSQNNSEINISELRDQAISHTMDAIDSYDRFYATQDKSHLIKGIKYASKANTLFEIYIDSQNLPEDSDLVLMTNGISRYSNDYAEELINVSQGSFEVNGDQVRANNDKIAQIIMHSFTNSKILKRWLEGWEDRDFEH